MGRGAVFFILAGVEEKGKRKPLRVLVVCPLTSQPSFPLPNQTQIDTGIATLYTHTPRALQELKPTAQGVGPKWAKPISTFYLLVRVLGLREYM